MPNFKVIEGGAPSREEQERRRERQRSQDEVERTICELAANTLRILRGAGKPYEVLMEIKEVIEAAVRYRKSHGHWPHDAFGTALRKQGAKIARAKPKKSPTAKGRPVKYRGRR